jgi:hypothetical protein
MVKGLIRIENIGYAYQCKYITYVYSATISWGYEPRSVQTKDYQIGVCCFSTKYAELRRKSKDTQILILQPTQLSYRPLIQIAILLTNLNTVPADILTIEHKSSPSTVLTSVKYRANTATKQAVSVIRLGVVSVIRLGVVSVIRLIVVSVIRLGVVSVIRLELQKLHPT